MIISPKLSKFMFLLICLAQLLNVSRGCVYKYGSAPEDMAEHAGSPWTYAFAGTDWVGTDAKGAPWMCGSGQLQSPINLPRSTADLQIVPRAAKSLLHLGELKSNGTNVEVINNGHTIQVEWLDGAHLNLNASVAVTSATGTLASSVSAAGVSPALRMPIVPFQFHFHTHSEHAIGGRFFPLEGHIVSRTPQSALTGCKSATGCITVIGVLFELGDDDTDNAFLSDFFEVMPVADQSTTWLPAGKTLKFDSLLPSNLSYMAYVGSLTTPPCSEDILWHMMLSPQTMSIRQLEQFLEATSDDNCTDTAQAPGRRLQHVHQHDHQHEHDHGHENHDHESLSRHLLDTETATLPGNVTCEKMGAGENYRLIQRHNKRTLQLYVDETSGNDNAGQAATESDDIPRLKTTYHISTPDAQKALGEGAIAGIVIGCIIGAGLATGVTVAIYKHLRKRREHNFWRQMDREHMQMMEDEYTSAFARSSELT